MTHTAIAESLRANPAKIHLAYAFNSTGKTRISVAYKNASKKDGKHTGVYYNAYSEDLFVWDNDEPNRGTDIRLNILFSSLSVFHASLSEEDIREKLRAYHPKFDFSFKMHDDSEKGIQSIIFFIPNSNPDASQLPIKISRGEERIFVWCFFLALFEVEGWADRQSEHFFIDDPVSSLDDHNIFVTATMLLDLIEKQFEKRKIIVTTHHIGLFSILSDWLTKGEKSGKFKKHTEQYTLTAKSGELKLEACKNDVFLYHLRILQVLVEAKRANEVKAYHFALLRQVLENVASFLGVGYFGYVLTQIGIEDTNRVADIVNALSHKKVYYYESDFVGPDNLDMFNEVIQHLLDKYGFVLHEGSA